MHSLICPHIPAWLQVELPDMPELMEWERSGLLTPDETDEALCCVMMGWTLWSFPLMRKLAATKALVEFDPHSEPRATMH